MPSATLTYTLTTLAVVFTQAVGGMDLESLHMPAWIVAITAAAALGARFVLYVQAIAKAGKGGNGSGGSTLKALEAADDREILTLVRQGHKIQERHLEELQLLRADLQEHQNATREMMSFFRRHEQDAAPAIEKIHRLHDAYFEGEGP